MEKEETGNTKPNNITETEMASNLFVLNLINSKKIIPYMLGIYFGFTFLFALSYDLLIPALTQTEALIFNIESFSGTHISFVDAYYFSVVTQTTVGFGDIVPASHTAKIVTSIQAFIGYFSIILFTTAFVSRIVIKKIIQYNMSISLPVDYSSN